VILSERQHFVHICAQHFVKPSKLFSYSLDMAVTKTASKPKVSKPAAKPKAPTTKSPTTKSPTTKSPTTKSPTTKSPTTTPTTTKSETKPADTKKPGDSFKPSTEAAKGPDKEGDKRATSLSDALKKNWKTFDADGDGHLTEAEVKKSLGGKELSPDEKAALSTLRGRQDQVESGHNDEFGIENDGMTRKDISAFDTGKSQDAKIIQEQFKIEQGLAREKPMDPSMKDKPADLSKLNGTRDFYLERYKDFRRRNPDSEAPKYYTDYGLKYFDRFHANKGSMDKVSQGWVDRTGKALQTKIEGGRAKDPGNFAKLERSQDGFRKFAYDTHPDAYVESGLKDVPWGDRWDVAKTPDIGDLANWGGVKQAVQTGARVGWQDLKGAGSAGWEGLKGAGNGVADFVGSLF
jgi:hypothetical protein